VLLDGNKPHFRNVRAQFLLSVTAVACSAHSSGNRTVTAPVTTARASSQQLVPKLSADGECISVQLFENGEDKGPICIADAQARGLTVVDLTDQWTPTLFDPVEGQAPTFRARYLELAAEKGDGGLESLTELYGVVPALSVAHERLADDQRHACHAAIDPSSILTLDQPLSQGNKDAVAAMIKGRDWLEKELEKERARQKLTDIAALEADPKWHDRFIRYKKLDQTHTALLAAQQQLHCEGWLQDKDVDGTFTWRMGMAVEMFQRRNFLMPTQRLDKETREALQLDSRELDYRLSLRILRERVTAAAGVIEDGTAGDGPRAVLGRDLDPPAMRAARGHKPMPNAAPDLVNAATEAAAKQLGWTGPNEVRAFLDKIGDTGMRVAIQLPPVPAYYSAHMELLAEIDRGDIYYEDRPPAFKRTLPRRPTLVLYVQDGETKRPLVRWPTTVGGWADQRLPSGRLVQKWKESDVGPRVWKDLTAAPTWIPPKTTPDRDLVKPTYPGWDLKSEIMGPGPRAAYGMVLLEHVLPVKLKDGTEQFQDNGIGTHGSSSVTSIVSGNSHGCHRMYNQLAVRLGDFLLHHRNHTIKGEPKVGFRRIVYHNGHAFRAEIESRGFQYELTPPVPVNVLKGNILSKRKTPPKNSAPARP
jgi:hypothetical protein